MRSAAGSHSGAPRFLVLGGGISGLLAAWHLKRAGREVEVWEASDALGGWAQTLPWPGPKGEPGWLERGPQGLLLGRGGALENLIGELGLGLRKSGTKGPRWLAKAGRRHPSPATMGGLLRAPGLSMAGKLRILAEPFVTAVPDSTEDLHSYFSRRLGEGFARELLPALVAGVLAAPPERIGLETLPRLRRLESRGGLLMGGLRTGPEHTRMPFTETASGTGTLAEALALRLGCVIRNLPARAIESLPDGRWRIHGDHLTREAEAVVLALPAHGAAELLRLVAPEASRILDAIPRLDLRVWHSRHAAVPGWERGFGLLVHPPEGRGLLGAVSFAANDPRGVPGLLQVRTYLGGAYPVDSELESWPGVWRELRRWLPELGDPVQVREEACPGAFPLLEVGHGSRLTRLLDGLPPNLHWLGASRFGPGIPDIAEGVETWARTLSDGQSSGVEPVTPLYG